MELNEYYLGSHLIVYLQTNSRLELICEKIVVNEPTEKETLTECRVELRGKILSSNETELNNLRVGNIKGISPINMNQHLLVTLVENGDFVEVLCKGIILDYYREFKIIGITKFLGDPQRKIYGNKLSLASNLYGSNITLHSIEVLKDFSSLTKTAIAHDKMKILYNTYGNNSLRYYNEMSNGSNSVFPKEDVWEGKTLISEMLIMYDFEEKNIKVEFEVTHFVDWHNSEDGNHVRIANIIETFEKRFITRSEMKSYMVYFKDNILKEGDYKEESETSAVFRIKNKSKAFSLFSEDFSLSRSGGNYDYYCKSYEFDDCIRDFNNS